MWAQIDNQRIDTIIPDGKTPITVYVNFTFSGDSVPEGTPVKFLIGKLPPNGLVATEESGGEVTILRWTESLVASYVTSIPGVELVEYSGVIKNTLIRDQNNKFVIRPVAKVVIRPIVNVDVDSVSVIAYCQYDKLGTLTTRLTPDYITLSVTKLGGGVFLSVNERYDIANNIWEEKTAMTVGRSGLSLEETGGKLYAIGGYAGQYLDAVEEYDSITDTWSLKTAMPEPRAFAASIVYGGNIYVFGGSSLSINGATDTTFKYDPILNEWTTLAIMPDAVTFGTAEVVGTKAYVFFGASRVKIAGNNSVPGATVKTTTETIDRFNYGIFVYDFSLDEWEIDTLSTSSATANLTQNSETGKKILVIPTSTNFPPYGVICINNGGGNAETVIYENYDSSSGVVSIRSALENDHFSGEAVTVRSLPHNRCFSNSNVNGTNIEIFNGLNWEGYRGTSSTAEFFGTLWQYNPTTKAYSTLAVTPTRQRARAGSASDGTNRFIVGGSDEISTWQNKVERLTASVFTGPAGFDKMTYSRHSMGAAYLSGYIYAIGGGGSGHAPGWLQITMEALPERIRADGRENSSITLTAVDDAGDAPPDGVDIEFKGVVFLKKAKVEEASTGDEVIQSSTGSGQPDPIPRISILPVLFSSRSVSFTNGSAATVLLARSEDPIKEVEELQNFASTNDAAQEVETQDTPTSEDDKFIVSPRSDELYSIASEATILDDFYFGTSDTSLLIGKEVAQNSGNREAADAYLADNENTSISNPPSAKQGLSAKTDFYSDIISMPDVTVMNDTPIDSTDAEDVLDTIREDIPFGASPHYDALNKGVELRVGKNLPSPVINPQNIMISASDNDESFSESSPTDIVEAANDIDGVFRFPIFVTSFVVTDPVSLAARRARTDVADLEKISSDTGGNSFSIVNNSYITYVIDRIKTSAPSSIGSGVITGTHSIDGFLSFVSFTVSNLVPGNSASMRILYSEDEYNYTDLGVSIDPNIVYSVGTPISAKTVKYIIRLESKTYDSPVLESVLLRYAEPNIQYLFTLPKEISGQIAELASVTNHRLPDGGYIEAGYVHGDSFMFERDYVSKQQPSIIDRGTSVAINRSFDTILEDGTDTQDRLETSNFLVYTSKSGNWPYDAILTVFVNSIEANPQDYLAIPEKGSICFKKRLAATDKVTIAVTQPQKFRVGLKIVNPSTTATGLLDSFAYKWGTTNDSSGYLINRPPRAVNLFITPTPVVKGGPMVANYTFVDPDGDEEDTTQTLITWFRNGVPVPELANKKTVRNSDFRARRADEGILSFGIAKGQDWFFTVRPSDGKTFGSAFTSPKITIADTPPAMSNIRLVSSNDDPGLFTSMDTVRIKFDFSDVDGEPESGSIYTWFANGLEVKSGKEAFIAPEEQSNGRKVLSAGTVVRVEIIPSTGDGFGEPVQSDTITIQASTPSVDDVLITPAAPTSISVLRLTYTFVDSDNLTDSSSVAWFKNGKKVSNLDNQKQVASSLLSPGQEWYAVVTPKNGLITGTEVKSNTVFIEF